MDVQIIQSLPREISSLMERGDLSYSELLQKIVELLSSAMQYPEAISVLLKIEDQEFKTRKFTESKWKIHTKIKVYETQIGYLEIFYRENESDGFEDPFLEEEKALIDVVGERIERLLEAKKELDWKNLVDRYALVLNFEELSQLHANVAHVVNSMEHIVNQPVSTDRLEHAKMYYLSYRDVDLRLLKKMEQLESSLMRG